MHRFNLIHSFHVKFNVEQIELFLKNFPKAEVLNRFEKLERWLSKYHKTNHDGTILTPPLVKFLSKDSDFDALLDELDRYREDTRHGRFDINNILQRDLEFRRFAYEYTRVLEPLTYQLPGQIPAAEIEQGTVPIIRPAGSIAAGCGTGSPFERTTLRRSWAHCIRGDRIS